MKILLFGRREERGVAVMERMGINFRNSCSQKGADEKFESLQFSVHDDESEIRFWIHVACLLFDEFDLRP